MFSLNHSWFDRIPGDDAVFAIAAAAPPSTAVTRTLDADAIYGAFSLLHGYYVSFVTRSRAVGPGPNDSNVFQVLHMEWVPVVNSASAGGQSSARSGGIAGSSHPLTKAEEEEEEVYLRLLRQISETKSFYFAQGYDITNTLQRNDAIAAAHQDGASASVSSSSAGAGADQASTPSAPRPSWLHADDRFFWNKSASRELIAANAHDFVTPIINGFVGCTDVSQFALSLLLISRRACTRQGTRFNMRGADADGNVANYAETEQLLLFGSGAVSSFTQIRGSIPLLWEQPVTMKYTPRCVVSGKTESSFGAFQKHMGQQLDRYGRVHVVSLIDKKGDQKVLGTAYMSACEKYGDEARLGNTWFDFHAETKGKAKWAALSKLMDAVDPALNSHGFYLRDATGKVVNQQHGVARTNCMDNLDRTNVVQSLFARRAALSAIPGALEQTKAAGCSVLTSPFPGFEHAFNNLWADNADALSILYSGTGALKTDFTRTGKRTLQGAINDGINSVTRYVLNNLVDGRTQDAWDLFLGRYVPERSRSEREGVLASSAGSGAASGSGGKGKKEDKVSPVRAHMLEVTPVRIRRLYERIDVADDDDARLFLPFNI